MSFEEITYEVDGRVATVTLNRPERLNAYTPTMHTELVAAFDAADADDDVRAVIVTGAGRGFCAGADLGGGGRPSTAAPTSRGATAAGSSPCASSIRPSR